MPPLPEEFGGAPRPPPNDRQMVMIPVDDMFSDGDESTWPTDPSYQAEDPAKYLEKLAKMWMQHTGEYKKGKNYIFSRLPRGYKLVAKARQPPSNIRDKFLAGHPSGVLFNSIPKFFDHFLHLMQSGTTECKCDLCKGAGRKTMASDGGDKGKQPAKTSKRDKKYLATDAEGNRDVFKELVYKLKARKIMDVPVKETDNMDWRAEREQLTEHINRIFMQHSFIPRVGELVLWCPELKGEVAYNDQTHTFEMICMETGQHIGRPDWRAGTIAQVPEEQVVLGDVLLNAQKEMAVNMSGFRIETYPDPNSPDKAFSSQYKYVPMSHIRPLSYWDILLQNVSMEVAHPSIPYALTIMSSFSYLDKYRFEGTWPNAAIYSKGVYLGAELLVEGDTVRLVPEIPDDPNPYDSVTDVLVIEKIVLKLKKCDADLKSPFLAQEMIPRVGGRLYTVSKKRAYRDPSAPNEEPKPLTDDQVNEIFRTVSMRQYGPWYPVKGPGDAIDWVTLNQIVGRCFEYDYMMMRFHTNHLGLDLEGVLKGRDYGRQTDHRITDNQEWFAGDYRLETLAVETFNGIEVGTYDTSRDLKMWQANLQIIDGTATADDLWDAKLSHDQGLKKASDEDIIGGKAESSQFKNMEKTSSMVSTALAPTESSTNVTSAHGTPAGDNAINYNNNNIAEETGGEGKKMKSSVGSHRKSSALSEQSEDSLNQLLQMPTTVVRGSTEETEGGDFMSSFPEPIPKRRKH